MAVHTGPDAAATQVARYPVAFHGSGSEYFRIWIVNLLLTFVTLGLYVPWAKVRKLKYFYGHTLVAGHALDFHGDPKKMLRGYLLGAFLFGAYSLAGNFSPAAQLVAAGLVALIWPALFRASLQFRLANTSWRGLRFRFTGSMADAYKVFAPGIVAVAGLLAVLVLAAPEPDGRGQAKPDNAFGVVMLLAMLGFYAVLPYLWFRIKRFQHNHYAFAQLQTHLRAGAGSIYKVFLKAAGVSILGVAAIGIVAAIVMAGAASAADKKAALMVLVPLLVLMYLVVLLVPYPYFTSRMQNLLWTNTGNRLLRFKSDLSFKPLLLLTAKNWLLTLLTLGLYWPFASVALARAKLEALSIYTRADMDNLVDAAVKAGTGDAAGDAAADLLGIDFGL